MLNSVYNNNKILELNGETVRRFFGIYPSKVN